jgi:hypothetical protein
MSQKHRRRAVHSTSEETHMRANAWIIWIGLFSISCGDVEGDEAGECRDGADNDQNGYFDCQDNGCWGSPDCDGVDPGTDTSVQEGQLDLRLAGLKTATITYTLAYEFDLPVFGIDSCVLHYAGTGDSFAEGADMRVTMKGTWTIVETDCPDELKKSLWVGEGPAFHSFVFSDDVTELTEWYTHESVDGHTQESDDVFYITEMEASVDVSDDKPAAHHTVDEDVVEIYGHLVHTLDVEWGT